MTNKPVPQRPLAIITGAHGGMGIACARVFGRHHKLLLLDRDADRLATLREALVNDGAQVLDPIAGDLAAADTIAAMVAAIEAEGGFGALVHAAGVSPSLADWGTIITVNLTATHRILEAVEPLITPGSTAVLIASIAAQMFESWPEMDAVLDASAEPDLLGRIEPLFQERAKGDDHQMRSMAYAATKYAVMRLCEQKAADWGRNGGRIVSITPGMISTPMGRREAEENPDARGVLDATPVGRWGTSLDIANAAEFLCSDLAGFISGCDLRVDGGITGVLRNPDD